MTTPTEAPQGTIELNNYLQARNNLAALTWIESINGPAHTPIHTFIAQINGVARGTGTGCRKFQAKDTAAVQALEWLRANE